MRIQMKTDTARNRQTRQRQLRGGESGIVDVVVVVVVVDVEVKTTCNAYEIELSRTRVTYFSSENKPISC